MKQPIRHVLSVEQIDQDKMKDSKRPVLNDMPLIVLRNLVMFPQVTFPITLVREQSVRVAEMAHSDSRPVVLATQTDSSQENPEIPSGIFRYGVIADIVKIIRLPDDVKAAIVVGRQRVRIKGPGTGRHTAGFQSVAVERIADIDVPDDDTELAQVADVVKETALRLIDMNNHEPEDLAMSIRSINDRHQLINLIATQIPGEPETKIALLRENSIVRRGEKLIGMLTRSIDRASIKARIIKRASEMLTENQREIFLRAQLEATQAELGNDMTESKKLCERFEKIKNVSDDLRATFEREIARLDRLNPQSPDYAVLYNYIDTLVGLPWDAETDDSDRSFADAEASLDSRHYGLEKIKERILEQIAVKMNTPDANSPIICLVGAPGVGKTSLGESIAAAMGRRFRRISLGGMHDEAEIRGHRRTYIGAMAGRVIDAVNKSGVRNPVIMLDEIDKMGSDFRGDPSSALLEVLDPEQNCRFHDNYVDVDFDLSKVMFVATANTLQGIPQPLLDRMELIEISGYLLEEKIEIARRHFIPALISGHNLADDSITVDDAAVRFIIEGYTAESGVRRLEKELATLFRRIVLAKMRGEDYPRHITVDVVSSMLGVPRYTPDSVERLLPPGVATGLAWTAVGGAILFIEASLSSVRPSDKLSLTGNLGDVMKESAMIALQWVRANAESLGIDNDTLTGRSLHIHVPEGATPKDGPSAGITMATAIVSAMTGRPVVEATAMTGELTLRGKILPVGGIKEKILAAKRAGITRIVMSGQNRKDVSEIRADYLDGLEFIYVSTMHEALKANLADPRG